MRPETNEHSLWWGVMACILLCLSLITGCRQDMHDQPRYEPFEASAFFADGRSVRPLVPGTVARGQLQTDTHFSTGMLGGQAADTLPFPVTRPLLERGQERYTIFCVPCHDSVGNGQGIIVQRGFRQPPSFHLERLREAPIGHFFAVMTNGSGAMADYATQIPPQDRWAITAYIRALQLSQHATLTDVPAEVRQRLESESQR